LYVEVDVTKHRFFDRQGDDLLCDVTIPMTAAALGTQVELPTLESEVASDVEPTVPLTIKPGTQSGERLVLRGYGVPRLHGSGRGDLIVTVVVETPTRLDAEQEALLRKLAALRGEEHPTGQVTG